MKQQISATVAAALLGACAANPQAEEEAQAVRDFIEVSELQEVSRMRTHGSDRLRNLTDRFVVYQARDGQYLVGFTRRCPELRDDMLITPDTRRDRNHLYAREDTLRGCRIANIYSMTEAQTKEIRELVSGRPHGN